jgi:hypothetical protein
MVVLYAHKFIQEALARHPMMPNTLAFHSLGNRFAKVFLLTIKVALNLFNPFNDMRINKHPYTKMTTENGKK